METATITNRRLKTMRKFKFKNPNDESEQTAILTLVEDRGDRVMVTCSICADLNLQPTFTYKKSDLLKI